MPCVIDSGAQTAPSPPAGHVAFAPVQNTCKPSVLFRRCWGMRILRRWRSIWMSRWEQRGWGDQSAGSGDRSVNGMICGRPKRRNSARCDQSQSEPIGRVFDRPAFLLLFEIDLCLIGVCRDLKAVFKRNGLHRNDNLVFLKDSTPRPPFLGLQKF
jgi:hypothetical protein